MSGKHIVLGITGSIAAYKSCLIIRALVKRGAEVQVVITPAGKEFITPITLSALSRHPVISDFFSQRDGTWHSHVDLGLWADAMLIAPCTASSLGKMAHGVADNMLVTTYLSMKAPVFIAPAMDLDMYQHPSTQANINTLKGYGNRFVEPTSGFLASGLEGKGRMQEPDLIVEELEHFFADPLKDMTQEGAQGQEETTQKDTLDQEETTQKGPQDQEKMTQEAAQKEKMLPLAGKRILITAGPTYERIDPVRFIGNFSSGKMGFSIAEECRRRGAEVTLVAGPTALQCDAAIRRVNVESAQEMYEACLPAFDTADAAILSAAVADFTPEQKAESKIKREADDLVLRLRPTHDIAKTLGQRKRPGQRLVCFALETNDEEANARGKLERKNADFVVLNSTRIPGTTFNADDNQIAVVTREGVRSYPKKSKQEVASDIIDVLQGLLADTTTLR
ncbi:MAG: bifunctional phosphopantothenoylcysteine decarboxylase/phosphopantothenate synthase [Prevotella sp.]|nr:bifunctional phosphopantothenoylcysteine decarboxylase/phosphopantothenate synthase [Prevotella sp.]